MTLRSCLLISTVLFGCVTVTADVLANCAMPVSYLATVAGNQVTIRPTNFVRRGCPDSSGMLRENVATGELVKLDDFCTETSSEEVLSSYVDECVPAGSYRYGFAVPYACVEAACFTDFFVDAKVESVLDSTCQRSSGNSGPSPAASKPWPTTPSICNYQTQARAAGGAAGIGAPPPVGGSYTTTRGGASAVGGGGTGGAGEKSSSSSGGKSSANVGGSTALGAGGMSNGGQSGDSTGTDPTDPDDASGCSLAAPSGSSAVFIINLLAVVTGLSLRRRRRDPAAQAQAVRPQRRG
jgi:hypothetical protein